MMRSVSNLKGSTLNARDGEIGSVVEAYFDDESWTLRYLVVDTGKWLTGRKVLISPQSVVQPVGSAKIVEVSLTREQVKNSPDIDTEKPVSRRHEREYLQYYGHPVYWDGPSLMAMGTSPLVPIAPPTETQRELFKHQNEVPVDEHLQSTAKVTGFDIQASDGSIGHVEDFIVDDESWAIRHLVVDTRNWWPGGKKVLLAVRSIERIEWPDAKVYVKLTRDAVKSSPDYDPQSDSERDYEARLYDAGRNQGHWS